MSRPAIFGAFTLAPRNCRRLGWFSVAALGLAIGVGTGWAPQLFEPRIEALHFLFSVVVLPTIALLAGQLSRLRADLHAQRGELSEALERIRLLAVEATRAHRERAPLCLCLIDLDHFKRVNDTLGHAAGDEVLRLVARQAKPVLRDTPLADAERVVERLRQHLSKAETWCDRPELRVTFSGGITAHHDGESMQETIARADDMLYRAKPAGRDRVLLAA